MIECFKICKYCRESCVLLILNCDTILKTAFVHKEMSLFIIFNKADDSVKNKGHLMLELLWNKTNSNLNIQGLQGIQGLQLQNKV